MIYSFNNDNNDRQRPAGKHDPRKIIEDLWHTKRNRKGYTGALRPGISSLSLWGHHRCRPVYGLGQYAEMGGAVGAAGLHYRRAVRVLHYAFDGEMLFLEPVAGSFAVYAHKYMNPYFGYLTAWATGLCGLPSAFLKSPPSGCMCSSGSRNTAVGAGADRRGDGRVGQPGGGAPVR